MDKLLGAFGVDSDYVDEFDEVESSSSTGDLIGSSKKRNINFSPANEGVTGINNKSSMKIFVCKPKNFDQVQLISDQLKEGKPALVNLEEVDNNVARRIVDFLGGVIYSLGGEVQKINQFIVLFVPKNVEIDGEVLNNYNPKEFFTLDNLIKEY